MRMRAISRACVLSPCKNLVPTQGSLLLLLQGTGREGRGHHLGAPDLILWCNQYICSAGHAMHKQEFIYLLIKNVKKKKTVNGHLLSKRPNGSCSSPLWGVSMHMHIPVWPSDISSSSENHYNLVSLKLTLHLRFTNTIVCVIMLTKAIELLNVTGCEG